MAGTFGGGNWAEEVSLCGERGVILSLLCFLFVPLGPHVSSSPPLHTSAMMLHLGAQQNSSTALQHQGFSTERGDVSRNYSAVEKAIKGLEIHRKMEARAR